MPPTLGSARFGVIGLCTAMCVMLGALFVTAVTVMPPAGSPHASFCTNMVDYPTKQPAEREDVGNSAVPDTHWFTAGCDANAKSLGQRHVPPVAGFWPAGVHPAQTRRPFSAADDGIGACAALLTMMLPGVDDPHLMAGACH